MESSISSSPSSSSPILLIQLALKETNTVIYTYENDHKVTFPWPEPGPVLSPILTLKPDPDDEVTISISFWSQIKDFLVEFHPDFDGLGFHHAIMERLRSGIYDVIAENKDAGMVSVCVEIDVFSENRASDPWEMFGELSSIRAVLNWDDPRIHNAKRFSLLHHDEEQDNDIKISTCAICLEELFGDDQQQEEEIFAMKLLPCHHVFHEDCIVDWLKQKDICPLCRSSCVIAAATD